MAGPQGAKDMTTAEMEKGGLHAVLLGEDDAERGALLSQLAGSCHSVAVADSVQEALERLALIKTDLAVLCSRPEEELFALAVAMLEARPELQVILVGPPADARTICRAMELGIASYCVRPVEPARLQAALSRCRRELALRDAFHCSCFVAANSDPRHAYLHLERGGGIRQLNDSARQMAPIDDAVGAGMSEFSLFASRALADRRGDTVDALLTAALAAKAWRGELYGNGGDGGRIYEVEVLPCPSQGTGFCGVAIREVSRYAAVIDELLLRENEALDLLQLRAPKTAVLEQEKLRPIELEALVTQAFQAGCGAPLTVKLDPHVPPLALAPAAPLQELCAGLALHVSSLSKVRSVVFSAAVKEHAPEEVVATCSFAVQCAVDATRHLAASDYLAPSPTGGGRVHGIGLAAARAEALGGRLTVKSVAEEGLRFSFRLRLQAAQGREAPPAPPAAPADSGGTSFWSQPDSPLLVPHPGAWRVLVADDNVIDQVGLKCLLEEAGCQVVTVGDGREAMDEFEFGEYDLVLMDILMPVMDGFEATRVIREQQRLTGARTPIIALTSYALKAVRDKCISSGMNGYISKPVKQADIAALLASLSPPAASPARAPLAAAESRPDLARLVPAWLQVLNVAGKLVGLNGRVSIYRQLVTVFEEFADDQLAHLLSALSSADAGDAEHAAHKLRGSAGALGGERLAALLKSIEELTRGGELGCGDKWGELVSAEYAALKGALAAIDWEELGG